MKLIAAEGMALGYGGRTVAKNICFSVTSGDFLSVVGENGTGKTTLLKVLLGLEKPTGGDLFIEPALRAQGIGYLPQQNKELEGFPASVYEVAISGRANKLGLRPFYNRQDRAAVQKALDLLGISHLRARGFGRLSGGERQRVLLARALCSSGGVLLLDEPTAGLDVLVTAELEALLSQLNRESGITIIMVSHDIASAMKHSKTILHLGAGGQLYYGTAADYAASDVGRLFLGGVRHV